MQKFPELDRIKKLEDLGESLARIEKLGSVHSRGKEFPLYSFQIGSTDKTKPTLALVGGVHGLERIGAQTVLAYFESLFEQLRWDDELRARFREVRLVSMPVVNPSGTFFGTRSNGNGVDLMRNSPVEAPKPPPFILGGHRISKWLPYYRGEAGAAMETESQALCDFIRREVFDAEAAMVLDVHSGFGFQDQLWYPYARSKDTFPLEAQVQKLKTLLDRSYPNHIYRVEPQSLNYTTHGDIWDYMFDEHQKRYVDKPRLFIPWTLEMGSWMWVRKNPLQLLTSAGRFNPVKVHRYRRTMRRHLPLFDFFLRAVRSHVAWSGL